MSNVNYKARWLMFVLIPTLQDYFEDKARGVIASTFDMIDYIEEKTSVRLAPEFLEEFLDSMVSNTEMFVVMLMMEQADELAESLVKGGTALKGKLGGMLKAVSS